MNCARSGCAGEVVGGYCDECGLAPRTTENSHPGTEILVERRPDAVVPSMPRSAPVATADPTLAVLAHPSVAERDRFCGRCNQPVGRSRDGEDATVQGFCTSCGASYSFVPSLASGDVLADRYRVAGCLAHGGQGWVYLAQDRRLDDRWVVVKGLLDRHDEAALAASLAERRFLIEIEHPNIVKIFDFVEHDGTGFIVMEYVKGRSLRAELDARRSAGGGVADPLPVPEAITAIAAILPAFGYLHECGLLYCDLKPDNMMRSGAQVKLIDLGGAYRSTDTSSPMFGTVGFQAPEVGSTGPTVASDVFTLGRTLLALCADVGGFHSQYRHTLPDPTAVDAFTRYDALFRFVRRSTSTEPGRRFTTAADMADQLDGVLQQVLAIDGCRPEQRISRRFIDRGRFRLGEPLWRQLPTPSMDDHVDGSAAGPLWAASALLEAGHPEELADVLRILEGSGAEADWRLRWFSTVALLADGDSAAVLGFDELMSVLPGELVPRLAVAMALELAGRLDEALAQYELVAATDAGFTSASWGASRCAAELGDARRAVAALERVPESSSSFIDARVEMHRLLLGEDDAPTWPTVIAAAAALDGVPVRDDRRAQASADTLEAALRCAARGEADPVDDILGCPGDERALRLGLEAVYRHLAGSARSADARIAYVDRANKARPWSWR